MTRKWAVTGHGFYGSENKFASDQARPSGTVNCHLMMIGCATRAGRAGVARFVVRGALSPSKAGVTHSLADQVSAGSNCKSSLTRLNSSTSTVVRLAAQTTMANLNCGSKLVCWPTKKGGSAPSLKRASEREQNSLAFGGESESWQSRDSFGPN